MAKRVALAPVMAALVLSIHAEAAAHGGFFRVHEILFAPDDPDFIVLRSDVWGMALTRDGGASWSWLCAEAYGRDSTTPRRVAMLVGADHRILVASLGEGLFSSQGDACAWAPLPELEGELVRDLDRLSDGRLLALSSRSDEQGMTHTRLWISDDEGASFRAHGSELPEGVSGISAGAAPSDPDRLYVVGKLAESVQVARSSDGGMSWQLTSFAFATDALTYEPRVAAIDPGDAEVVYLLIDASSGMGNQDAADSLLVSSDGGMTFDTLLRSPGDLPALAFSPDGDKLALGGIDEGLLLADAQAAASGDSAAFEQRWPGQIYGLRWTEDGLFAGGDDWNAEPRFSYGVSQDEGASFTASFSVCEVAPLQCEADSRPGTFCPAEFSDMGAGAGGFKEDFLDSERCRAPAMPDGGAEDAGALDDAAAPPSDAGSHDAGVGESAESGCSCRVRGSAAQGDAAWISLACAWLFMRRRYGLV